MRIVSEEFAKQWVPVYENGKFVGAKKVVQPDPAKLAAKQAADKAAALLAAKNAMDVHAMMVKEKKAPAPAVKGCPTMAELAKAGLIDDLTAGQWELVYKDGKLADVERPRGAAATPQGTLKNLVEAIKEGSLERLMDCVTGTADQKRYFALEGIEEAHYMYVLAMAMDAAYGKQAIEESKMRPAREVVDILKAFQAARIEIDAAADTAQVYMVRPGRTTEKKLFKMILADGLWRIENPAVSRGRTISAERLFREEKKLVAMRAAVKAVLPAIKEKRVPVVCIEDLVEAAMKASRKQLDGVKDAAGLAKAEPAALKAATDAVKAEVEEIKIKAASSK